MSIIYLILGPPRSGLNLLSTCLRILGIKPLETQPDASTINQLLLQDLGLSQFIPALPTDWLQSSAATRAKERIHNLLAPIHKSPPSTTNHSQITPPTVFPQMTNNNYPLTYIIINNSLVTKIWLQILQEHKIDPNFIHIIRHPWETAQSLAAAENLDLAKAHILWLSHTRAALRALEGRNYTPITFDQLLADPISTLRSIFIENHTPLTINNSPLTIHRSLLDFVQPSLKNHHTCNLPTAEQSTFSSYARFYDEIRITHATRGLHDGSPAKRDESFSSTVSAQKRFVKIREDSWEKSASSFAFSSEPDLIDSLLQTVGQQEKHCTLGTHYSSLKEAPPLFARVIFPTSLEGGQKTETIPLMADQWQKISLFVPKPELLCEQSIRISPLNSHGTVIISSCMFVKSGTGEIIWQTKTCEDYDKFNIQGPAVRVPAFDNLVLIITGRTSSLALSKHNIIIQFPIFFEFWIKASSEQTIIQRAGKNNIEVLLPVFGKELSELSEIKTLVNQSVFLELLNKLLLGAVSVCSYYKETNVLSVKGWYLPVSNYDGIELYDRMNKFIGQAQYRQTRRDVYEKYKAFNEFQSGWVFEKRLEDAFDFAYLYILVKKDGEVIKKVKVEPRIEYGKKFVALNDYDGNKANVDLFENELSDINVKFNNETIFSINVQKNSNRNILKLIHENVLDELVQRITLEIKYDHMNAVTYTPVQEKKPIVDNELIREISSYSDDEDIAFHLSYMTGNWPRIYSDSVIIRNLISRSGSILDIGSVPPLLTGLLAKAGYAKITAIDPNAHLFQRYFDRIEAQHYKLNIFDINQGSLNEVFDLVTFCEVIEHLSGDFLKCIGTICDYVKPDGYLYITTPNLRSIAGFLGLAAFHSGLASKYKDTVRQQYERLYQTGYLGHVREYTEREIINLIEPFGFQHVTSYFQTDYRFRSDVFSKVERLLSSIFPEYRLFGKYVFKKSEKA